MKQGRSYEQDLINIGFLRFVAVMRMWFTLASWLLNPRSSVLSTGGTQKKKKGQEDGSLMPHPYSQAPQSPSPVLEQIWFEKN